MSKFKAIMGGAKPSAPKLPPPVAPIDPSIERMKTENEATAKANADAAAKRKSRRAGSLLASGSAGVTGDGGAATSSVLASGKSKLGE